MADPVLIAGCINVQSPGGTSFGGGLVIPNGGPYRYEDDIFVLGYIELGERGDTTTFGVWRSADSGATWEQVGGSLSTSSLALVDSTPDVRGLAACQSADGQYLYVLHLVGSLATMRVSRFNCSTSTWDASSDGPQYQLDDNNNAGYYVAESSTTGDLHILANLETNGSGIRRVQRMRIPAPFGSAPWTSPVDVDGPYLGTPPNQFALACIAGYDGAVHGIFADADGFEVRIADIAAGATSVLAYTSAGDNVQPNITGASRPLGSDAQVMFVVADQGVVNLQLGYITGLSSAGGWAYTAFTIDEFSGLDARLFRDGSDFVLYRRLGVEALKSTRWSGDPGAFGPDADTATIFSCSGGGPTPAGIAATYSAGTLSGDNLDTWFAFVSTGGAGQQLLGGVGIPSEEAFGETSGIRGGGGPGCGPSDPIPAEPGCSVADPVPPPVSTMRCGYATAI